jgi:hypothetical protein
VSERFDGDWLARREAFDAASRSVALAQRLAAALPARPLLLDMGAGTGSLFRWLAPLIGRSQSWLLVDADGELLDRALAEIMDWGAASGCELWPTRDGVALVLGAVRWEVALRQGELSDPGRVPMRGADAVVCSALLDLVSEGWMEGFAARLHVPLLACLNVDGRDLLLPRHLGDGLVRRGFRRDQGRDKGFGGPALGPCADAVLRTALAARGFAVTGAVTDWRIPPRATAMLCDLVDGHAGAATRWLPGRRRAIEAWRGARLAQAARGTLAMRVGHRDTLALP